MPPGVPAGRDRGDRAICDDAFDLHGVSATTNAPSPLVIVNGPIRASRDQFRAGVFGPAGGPTRRSAGR
jgi:hypothetical protein